MNDKRKKITPQSIVKILGVVVAGLLLVGAGYGVNFLVRPTEEGEPKVEIEVKTNTSSMVKSEEDVTTLIENDRGELEEETLPTYEEIDGGAFEDKDTGLSLVEGEYAELGAIEVVDTDTPDAFRDSTYGRCIIANNRFGAQCVSLARAFWWDYAGRDVSTCGTGLAKGMMNCAEQNAGDDFKIIYDKSEIIKGTWVVTDGSSTGHICMTMGPVTNGYVACLGENQNGASCGEGIGGSATNIVNLSMKNFIGGYIPKTYIVPEPTPAPEPEPELPETSHGF